MGIFFPGSPRRNHVPWGRLSPWKWVSGISPGVKAAGAYGWRRTTLVVPNVKKIQGLSLPGNPWATSACCGVTFTLLLHLLICGLYEFWFTGFWWGNLRDRDHLGYPGIDGRIILRWIFMIWDVRAWTEAMWLRIGRDAGTCECGNEPSDSLKYVEFFD